MNSFKNIFLISVVNGVPLSIIFALAYLISIRIGDSAGLLDDGLGALGWAFYSIIIATILGILSLWPLYFLYRGFLFKRSEALSHEKFFKKYYILTSPVSIISATLLIRLVLFVFY